jgi:RNA polymerase sigma-54 factor
MKGIINTENKINPLSDSEIKSHLEKKGFKVARRTVAKYRLMEGIMPAHQRKMNSSSKND